MQNKYQGRFNHYAVPHKGLRLALGRLSARAGSTDYTNATELAAVGDELRKVAEFLHIHAEHEEKFFHAELGKRNAAAVERANKEHAHHAELEREIHECFAQVKAATDTAKRQELGERFYFLVNGFVSEYFGHLQLEEQEVLPKFWDAFTDKELIDIEGKLIATVPMDDLVMSLMYIVPGMNIDERARLLGGIKQGAPADFYNTLAAAAEKSLSPAEWTALRARIS